VFVGHSSRTNARGTQALKEILSGYGYRVTAVPMAAALHLKTACTLLDPETLLINRRWVEPAAFAGLSIVDVADGEPFGANTLRIRDRVLVQAASPRTAAALEARGLRTLALDIGEFAKAEAGLTCLSLVFERVP
jgi:dimethylargininase